MPALVGALYWKRATRQGALTGLVAGFIAVLATQFIWKTPFGLTLSSGAWGLLVNVLLFVIVSLLTPKPDSAQIEKFHGYLASVNRDFDEAQASESRKKQKGVIAS